MAALRRGARGAVLIAVAGAGLSTGCFGSHKPAEPEPAPVTLEIENHAFADMEVYLVTSGTGTSAIHLAMVRGISHMVVTVRHTHLQPGSVLQLRVRGIGTQSEWISPAMSVVAGERVALEINADARGNMNHTILYPLPWGDTLEFTLRRR